MFGTEKDGEDRPILFRVRLFAYLIGAVGLFEGPEGGQEVVCMFYMLSCDE